MKIDKNIVPIGPTGVGKSSLMNLLIGKELSSEKGKVKCDNALFKIGNDANSETKTQQECQQINGMFIDIPGLFDTEIFQRSLNLIELHQSFSLNEYCVLFMIDFYSVDPSNRCEQFIKVIKFILAFFKNLQALSQSAILVISKVSEDECEDEDDVVNKVKKIITDKKKDQENLINQFDNKLSDQEISEILEFIEELKNKKRIMFFKKPSSKHLKEWNTSNKELKEKIIYSLNEMNPLNRMSDKFSQDMLDQEARSILTEKLALLFREEKDFFDKYALEYFENQFKSEKTREFFSWIKHFKEQELLQNIKDQFYSYSNYLQNLSGDLVQRKEKFLNLNRSLLHIHHFFKEQDISKLISINGLSNLTSFEIGEFIVKAYFFRSSFLLQIFENADKKQKIVINANIFIVDSDLTLRQVTLIIKCETFIIEKNCIFDLSGQKGSPLKYLQVASGCDGIPGNPGFSGGDFILVTDQIQRSQNILTLNTEGGEGGDGQNGGDGVDGTNGADGNKKDVDDHKKGCLIDALDITSGEKNILSYNRRYRLTFQSEGTSGTVGGNPGKGGDGGYQGTSGDVTVKNLEGETMKTTQIKKVIDKNKNGKTGAHGRPGIGGKNGLTYIKVVRDEFVFPYLRGIKAEYSEINKKNNEKMIAEGVLVPSVSCGVALLAGEAAVAEGAVLLARTVSLPVAGFLMGAQLIGSAISASKNYEVEDERSVPINGRIRMQDGRVPIIFNCKDKRKPEKKIQLYCFKEKNLCKAICENNNECEVQQNKINLANENN